MSLFLNSYFFGWQNIGGGGQSPPPVPTAMIFNWTDSAAVWTDFDPEAIHNPVVIKLLVSGLLT